MVHGLNRKCIGAETAVGVVFCLAASNTASTKLLEELPEEARVDVPADLVEDEPVADVAFPQCAFDIFIFDGAARPRLDTQKHSSELGDGEGRDPVSRAIYTNLLMLVKSCSVLRLYLDC